MTNVDSKLNGELSAPGEFQLLVLVWPGQASILRPDGRAGPCGRCDSARVDRG